MTIPLRPAGGCCASPDDPLVPNPHSWTKATHLLYVEQPIGVGFSTPGTIPPPHNETDVANDFFAFLQNFYRVFEHYHKQDYKLHVTGESYAGIYVPSIAHKIYTEMKDHQSHKHKNKRDLVPINLAGIAIGNGLLNSNVQGPIRVDWAYYHGLIDMYTRDQLHQAWDDCMAAFDANHDDTTTKTTTLDPPFHAFNLPDDCGMLTAIPLVVGQDAMGRSMNVYDVTTRDPYDVLKVDSTITRFYNNPQVKEKLHAPQDIKWSGCIPGAGRRRRRLLEEQKEHNTNNDASHRHAHLQDAEVHRKLESSFLMDDRPLSVIPYIADLLDGGVRALFYNGDLDMAGNPAGTEMLLNAMKWHGASKWYETRRGLWLVDGEVAGFAKRLDNLLFVVVSNSGHLVPYNQPGHALDLITRFLKRESFYDKMIPTLNIAVSKPQKSKSPPNGFPSAIDTTKLESILLANRASENNHNSSRINDPRRTLLPLLMSFLLGIGVSSLWQKWQRGPWMSGYQRI